MRKLAPAAFSLAAIALLGACSQGEEGPTQRQQIGQSWKYETKQPQGGGTPVQLAYIGSANSVATMTAPDTFAVLLLQKLSNGEAELTVKLVGAPFSCDLSDCAIAASVDGKPAETWKGRVTDAKDGIEIPPARKAADAIMDSRTLKVDLVTGPKETHSFTFNTAGFHWKG
ncbi:hypothetical protein [Sphingobium aquiterrae]|uniref:hypothetical protein n=1 Tax=Sphingobium aquiterrae TaxID=2038656 RepID=UPI00301AAB68